MGSIVPCLPRQGRHPVSLAVAIAVLLVLLPAFQAPSALEVRRAYATSAGERIGGPPTIASTAYTPGPCSGWVQLPLGTEDQPHPRAYSAVTSDPAVGLGLIYGGVNSKGGVLNDTWVNDGDFPGQWANFSPVLNRSPPPLTNASLAYDAVDGYFVLFGGQTPNGTPYGGTWLFRNWRWTDLTPTLSRAPSAEASPAMTYDSAVGWVVLVGGPGPGSIWTFRAGTWSFHPGIAGPSLGPGEILTYDPVARASVLVGGAAGGPSPSTVAETWLLNRTNWSRPTIPAGPPSLLGNLAAYDPRAGELLLLTGQDTVELWAFDGRQWSSPSIGGNPAPAARVGATWYFDRIVGFDTLFGGVDPNHRQFLADVWGWGVAPSALNPCAPVAPVPIPIVLLVVTVFAVSVAWTILSRRRPPGKAPVTVPERRPRAIPAG